MSENTELIKLGVSGNLLTALDISNNTKITELYCGGNRLTSLNISNNMLLNKLCCTQSTLQNLYINATQNTNMNVIDEQTTCATTIETDNTIHKYTTTNISVVNN